MKKRVIILIFTLCLFFVSCNNTNEENHKLITSSKSNNEITDEKIVFDDHESYITFSFIEGQDAVSILAADDDYTSKFSTFDYASKYKSDTPLNVEARALVLQPLVLVWTEEQKEVISQAMSNIDDKIKVLNMNMPNIQFILTNPEDEGGAAYTRDNAIVLKSYHIKSGRSLEELIVHEMFHVFSRAYKELREDMYAVINYHPCEDLVMPDEIKNLTIANPDAPDNNFYIEGLYKGNTMKFIPIIYSSEAYDISLGGSFFHTLRDDMLAVEIIDGIPKAIYEKDQLLIVKKNEITDFIQKIGDNTDYTYYPEETMADNFIMLVFDKTVPSPWVLEGLKKVISN